MLGQAKYFIAGSLFLSIVFVSCNSNSDESVKVNNSSPKFVNTKYVELEQLHSIDVTQISLFNKDTSGDMQGLIDFDENNNMYILDRYECTISVFNERGKFVRAFGKAGQGPKEFLRPSTMIINKNKVYVFQGFHEYKIVDLEGEYISSHLVNVENRLKHRIVGDSFYFLRGKIDQTFTELELILSKYRSDFSRNQDLFVYKYPYGIRGPSYDFIWPNWLLILDNGEFYFPDANLSEYSITKYDKNGVPNLTFSRKYNIEKYSQEAKEWLYSFKSKFLSRYCLYNDGKIYRVLPITLDTFDQYIEVCEIKY